MENFIHAINEHHMNINFHNKITGIANYYTRRLGKDRILRA